MLAPWMGGACSPSEGTQGCRSMLAFWMGGACVPASTPPPAPSTADDGNTKRYRDWHPDNEWHNRLLHEDDEFTRFIPSIIPLL
jgi:hypothetical protein